MKTLNIAVIPGDGIGKEVVPEALKVLQTLAEIDGGLTFNFDSFPWSCDYYVKHGVMMPEDGLQTLEGYDAVFLGAVGNPDLAPDHVSLWGLLIAIRRTFEQSINLRPAKLLRGLRSPLAQPNDFDIMFVRENSEGEYTNIGGRMHQGPDEMAIQNAVFTRKGTERAIRYGFELALKRNNKLTSATKSNGIVHSMPFWDEVFNDVKQDYPNVDTQLNHIDALAAFMVTKPHDFDVVVGSNLFGDILTDIGAAIMGSIGIAPSANINPSGQYPSMFEPVHGSAPDIVGKGIVNPVGQIWTAKMMLDHFGYEDLGTLLMDKMEDTLEAGIKTGDIGGTSSTQEVTADIIQRLKSN